MGYSRSWQEKERLVARWFGTSRNPLSGRNNIDDRGERRLGDIVYKYALVEVKRRKSCSFEFAKSARKLAASKSLPWIVFEFKTGEPDLVKLNVNYEIARSICEYLSTQWEAEYDSKRKK